MKRRLVSEILIKLHEGDPLTQITHVDNGVERVELRRAGAPFAKIAEAIKVSGLLLDPDPGESVRMCFPRYAPQVRRRRERRRRPADRSLDHFLRVPLFRKIAIDDLVTALEAIPEVEWAMRAPALARPQQAVGDLVAEQGYLLACTDTNRGVNAEHAWTCLGGNGDGVRVGVCDYRFDAHKDLPPMPNDVKVVGTLPASPVGDPFARMSTDEGAHGTKVLGILASQNDAIGTRGITYASDFVFSSVFTDAGLTGALDLILDETSAYPLDPGDVLLVEAAVIVALVDVAGAYTTASFPAEADPAAFALIQEAIDNGIVVVECAGNDGVSIDQIAYTDDAVRGQCWHPEVTTGAIIVGAGHAPPEDPALPDAVVACSRHDQSNYGERVDCQGWGERVVTTTCDNVSADRYDALAHGFANCSYTKSFGGTSAASAIVTGVVASIQGAARENCGSGWSPSQLRLRLRDDTAGTPQVALAADLTVKRIGPLPDLKVLLETLGACPDVFLRDSITDDGTVPSPEIEAASPDIIVQRAAVLVPNDAFGAASWDRDDLSEEPLAGNDHFVYVRMKNRGTANDDVLVRVYWAEPSTFLTPGMWRWIGEVHLPAITPGEVRVTGPMTWAAADIPAGGASLIAMAISQTQASAFPEDFESDDDFQTYFLEHNEIAYRSVLPEVLVTVRSASRSARARFKVRRRGLRRPPFRKPPRGPCGLRIRTNLPQGSRIELASPAFSSPHSFDVDGRNAFEISDLGLVGDDPTTIEATVTLPQGAAGKYRITFVQVDGRARSGALTMLVNGG